MGFEPRGAENAGMPGCSSHWVNDGADGTRNGRGDKRRPHRWLKIGELVGTNLSLVYTPVRRVSCRKG
jgi:hypothetical protein